ncbi:MAG TPA: dihydropyrimidinase [Mesorhizobium sp.]|jgi:dihydropyrimidinase|nr:dihydropyrimidinase [Mesorhizobium sp.]
MSFDLVVRNGRVVTVADEFVGDIGIRAGRVAAVGEGLARGREEIDATGLLVLPGGVDAHCHIDEPPYLNARLADGFAAASRAAACGGTTTIVPFLNQLDGMSLREARKDYLAKARPSLIDYSFHLLLKAGDREALKAELPDLLREGLRSVKIFMTYPGYQMGDEAILDIMAAVSAVGGIVMVHAENGAAARWNAARLAGDGRTGLSTFAAAYPTVIEREAVHRAISHAELTRCRLMIVHVTSAEALEQIAWAKRRNLPVLGETCPQYLLGLGARLASDEWETAKYLCSPPIRTHADAAALWEGLSGGTLDILSSDHCPYRFDGPDGKKAFGDVPDFRNVPPGLPGLETRLPLLFEEGVAKNRISARRFVELTSAKPAMIYGLYPQKGTIAPGGDADIVLWQTGDPRRVEHADLHDDCDYTPYEGMTLSAWPVVTLSRGERVWDKGWVSSAHGRGRYVEPRAGLS